MRPRSPVPPEGSLALRGLGTLLACLLISALLSTLGSSSFSTSLVYSCCIGLLCWLAVDGGRHLAARLVLRLRPGDPAAAEGWPGWPAMALLIVLGSSLAYGAGIALADALTGQNSHSLVNARGYLVMLLVSIAVGTVITGFYYARAQIEHTRGEAEAARRAAAETQLKLLESQLEPHMLFNTLANLRALIAVEPARAQLMLDRLIDFLRATLGASRVGLHPLANEFARIGDYLGLMQIRMGERLQVELDLPPELAGIPVPALLLQPLVENAIKHGLEPHKAGGRICVRARRAGPASPLELEVSDTGVGLAPAGDAAGAGFGLAQVRERLATLYGSSARLSLQAGAAGGTLASIDLPAAPPPPPPAPRCP